MKGKKTITRRDFLKGSAGLLFASSGLVTIPCSARAQAKTKVVVIRNVDVLDSNSEIKRNVLQAMLDEAVCTLTGKKETQAAWKSLFVTTDVVGIKTNAWRYLPTPKELEALVHQRIVDVGIPASNIAIDDRGVLDNPVFNKATSLVNVRPARTHHWAGMGSCLKNYIMFVRNPSAYHDEGCSDLGKIWTYPLVKGKTRLNILCALTPQFYGRGANFFDRRYVWPYKGLIVGIDPVAVDAVGAELLLKKRIAHFGDDRALDVQPVHISVADKKYKLGVSDLSRIEIVKLGWQEEVLL
ncbi:MAG: hypothetical protein H6Q53_723 [Deltaproteobacteria bacterium]|nr:hypothetical protein [Deltaproteobacteria bacterium]